MSFFETIAPAPPPEPDQTKQPAWARPDTVIPGSVAGEMLLVRTDQAAVALGCFRAYPNGFEFTVHVRTRGEDEFGLGADPFDRYGSHPGRQATQENLRLGILYADGRRAATTSPTWPDSDAIGHDLILLPGGSGGSSYAWDGDYWVHPLPPDGPVTFVASWLSHGVAEVRAEVDGAAIRAGAQRAVRLWPEEPGS